jgi:uncharacterized membrane protein
MAVDESVTHQPPHITRLRFIDRSEVSVVLKYLIFAFNILVWLVGAVLLAIGIWAAHEKNITTLSATFFDPVRLLLAAGCVIFVIGFLGCIGALRENIYLLIVYAVLVGLILLLLIAGAVILFAFRDWVKNSLRVPLEVAIAQYRDDPDLQDLIDWVQADWLYCCGIDDYNDWEQNIYFNCSSPGVEACGVPFSCCQPNQEPTLAFVNLQCGYGLRSPAVSSFDLLASNLIYTKGCLNQGDAWFQQYMIPVAAVTVTAAVLLILGVCCASNLVADIKRQKAKWNQLH